MVGERVLANKLQDERAFCQEVQKPHAALFYLLFWHIRFVTNGMYACQDHVPQLVMMKLWSNIRPRYSFRVSGVPITFSLAHGRRVTERRLHACHWGETYSLRKGEGKTRCLIDQNSLMSQGDCLSWPWAIANVSISAVLTVMAWVHPQFTHYPQWVENSTRKA